MSGTEDDSSDAQLINSHPAHTHDRSLYDNYPPRPSSVSTPFSAFKHFIDDSLSALTNNFKNLPSNFAELRSDMEAAHTLQGETERDISARWTGRSDPPEDIQRHINRLSPREREAYAETARWILGDAADHNAHVPLEKIVTLYKDHESNMGLLDQLASPLLALGGTWMYMPEVGDTLPTASNWSLMGLAPNPRWLSVDWFQRSPYSPVRLEAHPDLSQDGEKWRAAFEDLILSALDKPMRSDFERDYEEGLPGLHWMLSLQYRGILPPLLPRFYSDVQARQKLSYSSILDIIRGCNTPWGRVERPWQDSLSQDFTDLREAVAVQGTVEDLEQFAYPYPRTELDMYEQQQSNATLQEHQKQLTSLEEQVKKMMVVARPDAAADEDEAMELARPADSKWIGQERHKHGKSLMLPSGLKVTEDLSDAEIMDMLATGGEKMIEVMSEQAAKAWVEEEEVRVARHVGGLVAPGGGPSGSGDDDNEDFDTDDLDDEDHDNDSCPIANQHRRHAVRAHEWSLLREAAEREKRTDLQETQAALFEALRKGDLSSASDYLQAWGRGHATAAEYVESAKARDGLDSVEFERLKDGRWQAKLNRVEEMGASVGEDERKRKELYRRLTNVVGEDEEWTKYACMTTDELEDAVEGLEEQKENLRKMVNGGKAVADFEELKRPDVLSALTTTQTTRLPDGTVTTKVVLKKRFGDGRQEIRESVHTYNEVAEAEMKKRAEQEECKGEKRSGWFWK